MDQRPTNRKPQQQLANPFSDPTQEDEVIQLQDFEAWRVSKSAPGGFVLEHPSLKPRHSSQGRVSRYLTPILRNDDDNTNSEWETVAGDDDAALKPSPRLIQRVENSRLVYQAHDIRSHARQATERAQRRNTALPPQTSSRNLSTLSTVNIGSVPRDDSQWPRTSSIYEDDIDMHRVNDETQQPIYQTELSRTMSKKRPATLGFGRTVNGDLVTSYSKSSSHASNDPFKFDGADYSLFLQPSAEKEVSRALYRSDTTSDILRRNIHSIHKFHQDSMATRFQPGSFYDNTVIQST